VDDKVGCGDSLHEGVLGVDRGGSFQVESELDRGDPSHPDVPVVDLGGWFPEDVEVDSDQAGDEDNDVQAEEVVMLSVEEYSLHVEDLMVDLDGSFLVADDVDCVQADCEGHADSDVCVEE
jgi:hypothetical protein